MSPPTAYQYVVLRCVPRPDREEFVNVGVVLYAQAADFLGCGWALDADRLRALHPAVEVAHVADALAFVDAVCAGRAPGAGDEARGVRFGFLKAPKSTVLQPGPVHGGLTTDPAAELARLVICLVH